METKELQEIKQVEWFDDRFYKVTYKDEQENEVTDFFPSVTTKLNIIAKPFLAKWRGDLGNRECDMRLFESSERGVRIHNGWYVMTTGGLVVYNAWNNPQFTESELENRKDAYEGNVAVIQYQDEMYQLVKLSKWLEAVKPKVVASEMTVYSIENRDAGTADNIFDIEEGEYKINGSKPLKLPAGRYLVDLKTGNAVDSNAYLQTACYAKCYEEMGHGEITGTLILHTGAKTKSAIEGLATLYRTKEQMEEDYQDYRLASALWERKNANAKPKVFEFPSQLSYEKEKDNG